MQPQILAPNFSNLENTSEIADSDMSDSKLFQEQDASVVLNSENEGTLEFSGAETMRVDDGSVSMEKKFLERRFPRVLGEEPGDYCGLVGLCEKTGLDPPPCIMLLPAELQRKILESLHGVDLAKVGCVCSELRDLSSDNELWKQKFIEEFGGGAAALEIVEWKAMFASFWKTWKSDKWVRRALLRALSASQARSSVEWKSCWRL